MTALAFALSALAAAVAIVVASIVHAAVFILRQALFTVVTLEGRTLQDVHLSACMGFDYTQELRA